MKNTTVTSKQNHKTLSNVQIRGENRKLKDFYKVADTQSLYSQQFELKLE